MTAPHAIREILVEPDYGQFYLRRSESEAWGSADVPSDGYERYLWSNGTFVMVGTVRKYGTTRLQVQVLATAPKLLPEDEWQHVVEESLGPGGDLEVFNWGGGEPVATVAIPHESVRLRVSWAGLVLENTFEGMDENGNSDESLLLQLWPQSVDGPRVIRCWPPLELPAPSDRSVDGRRQIEGLESVMALWDELALAHRFSHPYPEMPGSTQVTSSVNAVYRDRRDGTLWADGYDVRRTLRQIADDELAEMQRQDASKGSAD